MDDDGREDKGVDELVVDDDGTEDKGLEVDMVMPNRFLFDGGIDAVSWGGYLFAVGEGVAINGEKTNSNSNQTHNRTIL